MRIILALFLLLTSLQHAVAQTVTNVVAQPGSVQVNPNGSTTKSIRWRITVAFTVGGPITISSPTGTASVGATLGGPLSRNFTHPGGAVPVTYTLVERLYIDRTTANAIGTAGPGTYSRTFGAGVGTLTQTIVLRPSSSGDLAIRNLELVFDDGSRHRVVSQNTALAARLEVASLGRGFFAGRWEITGPTGTTAFRPIARVSKRLSAARKTIFESPLLRTDQSGIYRVRFVPEGIRPGIDQTPVLTLTYAVVAPEDQAPEPPRALGLITPQPGQDVTGSTRFSWQTVPGAARYRLEFTEPDAVGLDAAHLAAVEVESTSTRIRGFTLRRLNTAQRIYWHVVAYDSSGQQIAVSQKRRLR